MSTGFLAALDRAGQPLRTVQGGEVVLHLKHPVDLTWKEIYASLENDIAFLHFVCGDAVLSIRDARRLQAEWAARHDLGSAASVRRLAFLLDRWGESIEYDLLSLPGCPPLRELWATRRWRFLLNVIDHLPRNTFYMQQLTQDEEYVRMVVQAQESTDQSVSAPPMSTWSPEVQTLTDILDAVRLMIVTMVKLQTPAGKQGPQFTPAKRPETLFAKFEHQRKQARHEELAARMLPDRSSSSS